MAKQVEDIVVRLVGEGFEALDKIKGSFRELGKVTNLAEKDILSARDSLSDFAKAAGNTEAVNKGLIDAFKGLRSQVEFNSKSYRDFSNDIARLETELRGSTAAIDRQRLALLNSADAGKQNVDSLQRQVSALRQLQRETRPNSSAFLQLGKDIDTVTIKLGKLKSEAQAFNLALGQQAGATPEVLNRQIATLQKGLQSVRFDAEQFVETLRKIQLLQITQTGRTGRAGVIADFEAFRSREYTGGFADPSRLAAMPNTTAALNQELAELSLKLNNVERGGAAYVDTSIRIADIQKRLRTELLGTTEAFRQLDIAQTGAERRSGKLADIQEYYRTQGPTAPGVGGFRDPVTGAMIAAGSRVQTGIRPGTQYDQPIGPQPVNPAFAAFESSMKQSQDRITSIYDDAYVRRTQLQADFNQISIDKLLTGLDMEGQVRNAAFGRELADFDKQLEARDRRRGRRLTGSQLAQGAGAAISGGIFGGPEGLIGGLGGLAVGGVGGAFAGAAAGAQVGMFRQQLAGTADYAASIGKLQIALRGVVGSQEAYDAAIRSAAAATRDLNIPQEEATRGLTRLSAAVIGAGGTVADSSFAFRAMSEAIKATGGNAEQVDGALLALTQVFSKGKVSAEELNQIAERLPGTFTLFAQAAGKTGPELQKALEQGEVGLNDLMKFLALTGDRYGKLALDISSSSQDAGARLTVAFQAMRLEVGNALQPLGAELQGAFATFIRDITPAVVGSAKAIAAVLSFLTTNDLVAFGVQLTAVSLGFKGLQVAVAALTSLNVASWFTATAVGAKVTSSGMAAATVTTGGLTGAIKALTLAMAKNPLTLLILAGTAAAIKVGSVLLEQKKLNDEVQRSLDIAATAPASGIATEINTTENALREARSKLAGGLQGSDVFGFGLIAAEADVARLEAKLQKLKTTFKGRVEIETIFKGLGAVPEGYKVVNGRLAYLSPGQGYVDAETGKPVGKGRTNFPGGGGEDGGEKAGAALLQAIEQREEALLNLRTQREEQLAQIREQAVEQAKQIETQLADRRLAIERQIQDIARQRSDSAEDSERRIRAARGEDTGVIDAEQKIVDIFREERDSRIDSERRLADDKQEQERTIAEFQTGVAKSINDVNRAHTKSMGEIQKQYATSVAKIIDEGTGKAGKRLEKAAQIAAIYIQRSTLNNQILAGTGMLIPERRQGSYDFSTVGRAGAVPASDIQNVPTFKDVKIPLDAILKLDETLESLRKGLSTLRTPGIQNRIEGASLLGTGFDVSKIATDFGQIASASFIGGLLHQNPAISEVARNQQIAQAYNVKQGDRVGEYPSQPRKANPPTFYRLPVIPSAEPTTQLRNTLALDEKQQREAETAQKIKEAFEGINAEAAQFTNGLNDQIQLLEDQRKYLDMGFSDALSRDLANLDKGLADRQLQIMAATDQLILQIQAAGEDTDPTVALGAYADAVARSKETYDIQVKITKELEKQTKALSTRQDNRIGLGAQEGVQAYLESIGTMRDAFKDLTVNGIQGVENAIFELVTTGKTNFREFAADMLRQTARIIIQQLVLRQVMMIVKAAFKFADGGVFAPSMQPRAGYAKGGAFGSNNIIPYAKGGTFTNSIVSRPTLFKFAAGGTMQTGLMGEAGPEAIMPLKRGPGGKLGVLSSGGGGGTTNVTVNVDASGSKTQGDSTKSEQLGRAVSQAVQDELLRQRRPGGILAS